MFDEHELDEVLELQRRTYQLIRWVAEAIKRGFIPFDRAHEYSTATENAEAWLDRHYSNLPVGARPEARSGPELRRYANFLVSYLQASFELDPYPGLRLADPHACRCSFCATFESASHLKTKKLGPKDKTEAQRLKRTYLTELALQNNWLLDAAAIESVLGDEGLDRDAALATYAAQLLRRAQGARSSPAVLALWREIAWTKQGSPNPKFRLRTRDIVKAERNLLAAVGRSEDA